MRKKTTEKTETTKETREETPETPEPQTSPNRRTGQDPDGNTDDGSGTRSA